MLSLKESRGIKHSTISRYKDLATRIYPAIGHLKLKDIRADHLNDFYTALSKSGVRKGSARAYSRIDLDEYLKTKKLTRASIAASYNMTTRTVSAAIKGEEVSVEAATVISEALELKLEKAFEVREDSALYLQRQF